MFILFFNVLFILYFKNIFSTGKYLSILAHLILIKLQMVTTLFYHFNCKTKNRETGRLRILLKIPQIKHHTGSGQILQTGSRAWFTFFSGFFLFFLF